VVDATLVGIFAGVAGAVSGAVGTFLARRYRIKADTALTEQRRLFARYRRLVSELRQQVAQLRGEVTGIQGHYLECRLENASLRARVAELDVQAEQTGGKTADGRGEDPRPADRGQPGGGDAD
jgi:hypothetical protein